MKAMPWPEEEGINRSKSYIVCVCVCVCRFAIIMSAAHERYLSTVN